MRYLLLTTITIFSLCMSSVHAQQTNPFDQLYRDTALTRSVSESPKPANRIDTSDSKPAKTINTITSEPELISDTPVTEVNLGTTPIDDLTEESQPDGIEVNVPQDSTNPFEYGSEFEPEQKDTSTLLKSESIEPATIQRDKSEDHSNLEIAPAASPFKGIKKKMSGAILTLIFLAIFLLLTIIVNINRGLINKIYRAALNENFSALLYRESRNSALNYLYPLAYVIFFLNIGLFLYLIQFNNQWNAGNRFSLWLLTLIPLGIYMARHLILRLLGGIFPIGKEINQFNFNIMVFNIVLGLILIPINLFLAYGPDIFQSPLLYGTLFIIGTIYIFRQLRGLLISSRIIMGNVFLFFIYLCTVEILPLLVIFKIIV